MTCPLNFPPNLIGVRQPWVTVDKGVTVQGIADYPDFEGAGGQGIPAAG
jgi:hypothetical protein